MYRLDRARSLTRTPSKSLETAFSTAVGSAWSSPAVAPADPLRPIGADGEHWHAQRKATSKIFNANNFRGIITQSLDANLEKLLAIIRRHADAGEGAPNVSSFLA